MKSDALKDRTKQFAHEGVKLALALPKGQWKIMLPGLHLEERE